MDDAPDGGDRELADITLFPNRNKRLAESIVLGVVCTPLVAAVCWGAYSSHDLLLLIVAVIPGLGIAVAIVNALPRNTYLKISAQGFEFRYLLGRRRRFVWSDTEPFRVIRRLDKSGRKIERVCFDLTKTYRGKE